MRRLKEGYTGPKIKAIEYRCDDCRHIFTSYQKACKVRCTACGSNNFRISNLNGNTKI